MATTTTTLTLVPGQAVEWLCEYRGGYGYTDWVLATVVRVGAKRVTIDVELKRGGTKRKVVTADRLRARKAN